MNAFSFGNRVCPECGEKLILAARYENGECEFTGPGVGAEAGTQPVFCCVRCQKHFKPEDCAASEFHSSRIGAKKAAELGAELKGRKSSRIDARYLKNHALTAGLMLTAALPSFYFARTDAIRLILPAAVGYIAFVCWYNLLEYISTRYYVLDSGVLCRSMWGYSYFSCADAVAFVRCSAQSGDDAWGLFTSGENLLVSPIITSSDEMISGIRTICTANGVPVLEKKVKF